MKSSVAGTLLLLIVTSFSVHSSDVASGGKTSVRKEGANAFSLPAANLPMSKRLDFSVGNSFFVTLGCKLLHLRMLEMD